MNNMVIEKLKEWQDKKDELEDQQILAILDDKINNEYSMMLMYEDKYKYSRVELAELFHQYFLIKWEHHSLDHDD